MQIHKFKTLGIIIVTLFLAALVALVLNGPKKRERLIVMAESSDGGCALWYVNPENGTSKELTVSQIANSPSCYHAVVQKEEQTYLLARTNEPEGSEALIIFEILPDGELREEQVLPLGDIQIMSELQWTGDDHIYFSGLSATEHEQIFHLNKQTSFLSPYIKYEDRYITYPHLSPSGKFLIYLVPNTAAKDLDSCLNDYNDCIMGQFHLWNIEQQRSVPLNSLVQPSLSESELPHCGLEWSPTGRWLAVLVECQRPEGPDYTAIIDTKESTLVDLLRLRSIKWVSSTTLVVEEWPENRSRTNHFTDYFYYSAEFGTIQPMFETFPALDNMMGMTLDDWSQEGQIISGRISVSEDEEETSIFILQMRNPHELSTTTPFNEFVYPSRLSPSGKWVAFSKAVDEITTGDERVYVANSYGEITAEIAANMRYPRLVWMQ
jgi:hypothetical protein